MLLSPQRRSHDFVTAAQNVSFVGSCTGKISTLLAESSLSSICARQENMALHLQYIFCMISTAEPQASFGISPLSVFSCQVCNSE